MDAVFFDLDGVLLAGPSLRAATGTEVAAIATERALETLGVGEPPSDFLDASRWGSYAQLVEATETFDVGVDAAELWRHRERELAHIEQEHIQTGTRRPYEDVEVIGRLSSDPVSLGVASNARHGTVVCAVEHLPFDPATTLVRGQFLDPADWYRRKPDPCYIRELLDRSPAETGMYVGDSASDIVAAERAGLDPVYIRRDHNGNVDHEHDPKAEIDTLSELFDLL